LVHHFHLCPHFCASPRKLSAREQQSRWQHRWRAAAWRRTTGGVPYGDANEEKAVCGMVSDISALLLKSLSDQTNIVQHKNNLRAFFRHAAHRRTGEMGGHDAFMFGAGVYSS